ncbi:MAG: hypothetical protein V2A56_09825 [bacterium]
MQSRSISLLLVAAFVATMIAATVVFGATEVVVDGVGADRETALLDAQRNAVATVVGQMVDSKTLVANYALVSDKILTSSSGYVKTYQVVTEGADPAGYRVRIRAVIETGSIRNDVNAIAVLSARQGNPRFIVVPDPSPTASAFKPGDPAVDQAKRGVQEYLAERQLQVIEAPAYNVTTGLLSPAALKDLSIWGAGLGAEYVVYYSVQADQKQAGRTFKKAEASVDLNVVHTGSYRIVAQVSGQAMGSDKDAGDAVRKAAREAGKNAAGKVVDLVLADWSRTGTTAGQTITLAINNIQGNDLQAFEDALQQTGMVKQVMRRDFKNGSASLQVMLDGGPSDLGAAVAEVLGDKGWNWALTGGDSQSLTYTVPEEVKADTGGEVMGE